MKKPSKNDKPNKAKPELRGSSVSAVNLPRRQWDLLRKVADYRADRFGGRSSMSAVIAKLIEDHREELESELVGRTV